MTKGPILPLIFILLSCGTAFSRDLRFPAPWPEPPSMSDCTSYGWDGSKMPVEGFEQDTPRWLWCWTADHWNRACRRPHQDPASVDEETFRRVTAFLVDRLGHWVPRVRAEAAMALAKIGALPTAEKVAALLDDTDPLVRAYRSRSGQYVRDSVL